MGIADYMRQAILRANENLKNQVRLNGYEDGGIPIEKKGIPFKLINRDYQVFPAPAYTRDMIHPKYVRDSLY
jgi:hypothetical protein